MHGSPCGISPMYSPYSSISKKSVKFLKKIGFWRTGLFSAADVLRDNRNLRQLKQRRMWAMCGRVRYWVLKRDSEYVEVYSNHWRSEQGKWEEMRTFMVFTHSEQLSSSTKRIWSCWSKLCCTSAYSSGHRFLHCCFRHLFWICHCYNCMLLLIL